MKAESIIEELEALISAQIKTSNRHGLPTIQITTPRARMLMNDIQSYKKAKTKVMSKHIKKEPAWLNNPE
jgi:methionine synthase II (cobalamin-independent)